MSGLRKSDEEFFLNLVKSFVQIESLNRDVWQTTQ